MPPAAALISTRPRAACLRTPFTRGSTCPPPFPISHFLSISLPGRAATTRRWGGEWRRQGYRGLPAVLHHLSGCASLASRWGRPSPALRVAPRGVVNGAVRVGGVGDEEMARRVADEAAGGGDDEAATLLRQQYQRRQLRGDPKHSFESTSSGTWGARSSSWRHESVNPSSSIQVRSGFFFPSLVVCSYSMDSVPSKTKGAYIFFGLAASGLPHIQQVQLAVYYFSKASPATLF